MEAEDQEIGSFRFTNSPNIGLEPVGLEGIPAPEPAEPLEDLDIGSLSFTSSPNKDLEPVGLEGIQARVVQAEEVIPSHLVVQWPFLPNVNLNVLALLNKLN